MTIKDAIDALEEQAKSVKDGKTEKKLTDVIADLRDYMASPERGEGFEIAEPVSELIARMQSRLCENGVGVLRQLQKAVLDMIFGNAGKVPNFLFVFTLVFSAIGILVPLIWNSCNDDRWFFAIESAKDIVGVFFETAGAVCAFGLPFSIKKANSNGDFYRAVSITFRAERGSPPTI